MAQQFSYISEREMPPKPGVKFFTTYYQQTHAEYRLTRNFVVSVAKEIMDLVTESPDAGEWFCTPLRGYRRSQGTNYTPEDIVTDMVRQFSLQRDIPSGMLGRWRRLFQDTRWDFELVKGTVPRPQTLFQEHFS